MARPPRPDREPITFRPATEVVAEQRRNLGLQEISTNANKINVVAAKNPGKEISSQQDLFSIELERDVAGIGMGVLSDGTPYLNQRGLATLVGVENAHIGTISKQWNESPPKPRIAAIKTVLEKAGFTSDQAHVEIVHQGRTHYCYPSEICLAILEYYAFDAGPNCQEQARDNFRLLAGSKLRDLIYSQVGYDPTGQYKDRFKKWHERIELNHQSAPRGYFSVFNEAHTIIYEMIQAGADIGEKTVVDISIGQHWSKHWEGNSLTDMYGERQKYPHRYPTSHPQALSNPQVAWCYPLAALGAYREWLQSVYIENGKFSKYIKGKVQKGDLPPSIGQLAIEAVAQNLLPSSE